MNERQKNFISLRGDIAHKQVEEERTRKNEEEPQRRQRKREPGHSQESLLCTRRQSHAPPCLSPFQRVPLVKTNGVRGGGETSNTSSFAFMTVVNT